ncbi:MAG: diacylglycerol/lipid kinase family protein, partial [Owenweeksia sp.]
MSKTTLFVVNPIAGGIDKSSVTSKINSWGKSSHHTVKTWETTGEDDINKLKSEVDKLQPDQVVAIGGDGTLMLCAIALKDSDLPLGLIPAGSANGMASELEIPENVNEALQIIEEGHFMNADMLCFNNEHYGLHISDIGLNANLVKNFEESGRRGFLGYAGGIISELVNLEAFKVRLKLDEREIEETCYMVAFANARRYGTGALLNYLGKMDDGLFEVCILRKFDITGIAGQFLDILDEESEHLEVIQGKELFLEAEEARSFQIDGELQPDTARLHV